MPRVVPCNGEAGRFDENQSTSTTRGVVGMTDVGISSATHKACTYGGIVWARDRIQGSGRKLSFAKWIEESGAPPSTGSLYNASASSLLPVLLLTCLPCGFLLYRRPRSSSVSQVCFRRRRLPPFDVQSIHVLSVRSVLVASVALPSLLDLCASPKPLPEWLSW